FEGNAVRVDAGRLRPLRRRRDGLLSADRRRLALRHSVLRGTRRGRVLLYNVSGGAVLGHVLCLLARVRPPSSAAPPPPPGRVCLSSPLCSGPRAKSHVLPSVSPAEGSVVFRPCSAASGRPGPTAAAARCLPRRATSPSGRDARPLAGRDARSAAPARG